MTRDLITNDAPTHIWLRAESKLHEERAALTPVAAAELVQAGFKVTVEKSQDRIFSEGLYEEAGCEIAETGSWHRAPAETIILGLKELRQESWPLVHRHIHFAHVFKQQAGWQDSLGRFVQGGGTLFDLEYLVNESGRRVAAFGYWAGFAGTALAVQCWYGQQLGNNPGLKSLSSFPNVAELVRHVTDLASKVDRQPVVLVVGARGRSGQGAIDACRQLNVRFVEWDVQETRAGGPFQEILEYDVLLNCVFVQKSIPPFLTDEMLDAPQRQLRVICDVSCDPYGDYNPLPIYNECTTFNDPVIQLRDGVCPLELISIDHLPSLLPRESSEDYCDQLLPSLLQLNNLESPVWQKAKAVFDEKCQSIRKMSGNS